MLIVSEAKKTKLECEAQPSLRIAVVGLVCYCVIDAKLYLTFHTAYFNGLYKRALIFL
jgi:hypothetical protein